MSSSPDRAIHYEAITGRDSSVAAEAVATQSHSTRSCDEASDLLSRLPSEITDRIIASIADHRSLVRLCCVSKRWSFLASSDAHWRALFLARWRCPPPRATSEEVVVGSQAGGDGAHGMRSSDGSSRSSNSSSSEGGAPLPIEKVAWKKLYEYRLALEKRWTSGQPIAREFPLQPNMYTNHLHPDFIITCSSESTGSDCAVVQRSDFRLIHTFPGPPETVIQATVNSEGSALVTGTSDCEVRVWDSATGQCKLALHVHQHPVFAVGWVGPSVIFTASPTEAKVWDAASGTLLQTIENAPFNIVSWSTNGDSLFSLSRGDGAVRMWNPATGRCERVVLKWNPGFPSVGNGLTLINAKYIAVNWIVSRSIRVWDIKTGDLVSTIAKDGYSFDMNESLLLSFTQHQIRMWDIGSGLMIRCVDVPQMSIGYPQVNNTAICFCDLFLFLSILSQIASE
ncbi:quinon protein alcohol dehydrogenase-like superfamily [Zopfochytrium polystomum]|nr:quinon protein alcohol dehydrogenase-like superfamily [Zopfochytrium polystomum]